MAQGARQQHTCLREGLGSQHVQDGASQRQWGLNGVLKDE